MTWLVRQPGETLAERAGDQQRVLAVTRDENFDTLENRVLRAYCDLAAHVARDYLELYKAKRSTTRARKVEAFGRASRRLARQLSERGVRLAEPGLTPNFVLQHNVHYHKIWTSWHEFVVLPPGSRRTRRWQARSWEEFCALAVVVALVGIPGARLIAAAPLDFLDEQNCGWSIAYDNPLAAFYLAEQKIVVEVRYRMRSPDRRLSDFAAPIWVRFGRSGDVTGFLGNIAVWPIWTRKRSRHDAAGLAGPRARGPAKVGLGDVLPVGGIEPPGEHDQQAQEQQHADADADPRALRRLAHPLQVGHQVADGFLVFEFVQRARRHLLEALEPGAWSCSDCAGPSPR